MLTAYLPFAPAPCFFSSPRYQLTFYTPFALLVAGESITVALLPFAPRNRIFRGAKGDAY